MYPDASRGNCHRQYFYIMPVRLCLYFRTYSKNKMFIIESDNKIYYFIDQWIVWWNIRIDKE